MHSKKSGEEAKTNDGEKKPSFWETLPGILTAAGTLIAACTGLVVALHTAGIIGVQKEQDKKPHQEKTVGTNNSPPPKDKVEHNTPAPEASPPPGMNHSESVPSQAGAYSTSTPASPTNPIRKLAEKKFVTLTISEGESQHLDFANTDIVLAAFQNMNGEKFITLQILPTGEEARTHAAFSGSRIEFASAGSKYAVQITQIDYVSRRVTLTANCVFCP